MKKILMCLVVMNIPPASTTVHYEDVIFERENLTDRIDPLSPTLQYTCQANGTNKLSHYSGADYVAEAKFNIVERRTIEGLRVIAADGRFKFARQNWEKQDEDEYTVKIEYIEENPYYRPRRYKNYSQFPNFDFIGDMWGDLIISKETTQDKFYAHYLFQQGDHMGGTLHLSCSRN